MEVWLALEQYHTKIEFEIQYIFEDIKKAKINFYLLFLLHKKYDDFRNQIIWSHVTWPCEFNVILVEFSRKLCPCKLKNGSI